MAEDPIAFFDAPGELVRLIVGLVRRDRGRDRPLPLLCLVRSRAQAGIIGAFHDSMNEAPPRRVPHALVDVEQLPKAERAVRGLLSALRRQLSLDNHGFPPIKFRHFQLVTWLMDQDYEDEVVDQAAELTRRLRRRLVMSWLDVVSGAGAQALPAPLNALASSLLRALLRPALFRALTSGWIPGAGREFRWLMRQRYVVPRLSTSFAGFGVRLSVRHREGEQSDQVDRLLMHAFLEDLRVAYARRPWRPGDWRRTAYPVALLDHAGDADGGWALLRLIMDVRNETGQFDPLLVVSAGERAPDGALFGGSLDVVPADDGRRAWERSPPAKRRRLDPAGWYLPIRVPEPAGGRVPQPPISPDPPPWWARKALPVVLGAVVILTASVCGAYQRNVTMAWAAAEARRHCGFLVQPGGVDVQTAPDGECIGYSDNASYVFQSEKGIGEADLMMRLQHQIFDQNRQVDQKHADPTYANLRVFTLVYLAQLAIPAKNTAIVADEREELEGIAIRQGELLAQAAPQGGPLLKVILANGGTNMQYAPDVADMLGPLVASTPSIVGVLGFDESRDKTVDAIKELNRQGLPMIAPTLSADGLSKNSDLYYQIVPPNHQEAELMAQYAASQGLGRALVLYEQSPGDLYTSTLYRDLVGPATGGLEPTLQEHKILVDGVVDWADQTAVLRVCAYPGAVLFTGRAEDFDKFQLSVTQKCGDRPPVHPMIADDSVSRFMASSQERRLSGAAYPLAYVSKADLTAASCSKTGTMLPVQEGFITRVSGAPWSACDAGGSKRSLGAPASG